MKFLFISTILTFVFTALAINPGFCVEPITRNEVQTFFRQCPKNAALTPIWKKRYVGQAVDWQGKVFKTRHREASHRQEVYVKILEDSHFYDTVVVLEAGSPIDDAIEKGAEVSFTGKIFHGVDTMGVKHVSVKLKSAGDIQVVD